ncbi:MAG: response regulator transcription factor [Crocinitomix sp.]|nr:response regulator transcription factor [Crocinitomix sp.]
MEGMVRISVLDKHDFVIDNIRLQCDSKEKRLKLISFSNSEEEFYACPTSQEIEVLMCDVNFTLEKGLSFCKSLRKNFSELKILVFS